MKRLVISVILALSLLMVPVSGVFAATSQTVEITATPTFVSISNDIGTWPIGTVSQNDNYWWKGSAPTFPLDDAECTATITNGGTVAAAITITGPTFTSAGTVWTLVAATPGDEQVIMKAGKSGDSLETNMVTLTAAAQPFITSLAAAGTIMWEMKLTTGTFTHGNEQSGDVTLTASAA